jgi:hypothetical protein
MGGAGGAGTGGTGGTPPPNPPDLTHTFEPIDIAPGQEITGICQSWTLENDSPIYVNRIDAHNAGGVHHSNWIWVPDNLYTGPDGTFSCADRGFDQIIAGAQGGVFFAQSTQSQTDTQQFPEGVAFEMPARVRIIGDIHLLNASIDPLSTDITFDIYGIAADQVTVPLQPMAFTNLALDIAPQMETQAHMQCATPTPDFDVYYVLPHYHAYGTSMRIDIAGGPMDGTAILDSSPTYGEPWGRTYDPPFSVQGAAGLGITCTYQNTTGQTIVYGPGTDGQDNQEMCVTLIYTSGRKAGGMANANLTVTDSGGVHMTDGLCLSIGQ